MSEVLATMVKRTGHGGRAMDVPGEPFTPKKRTRGPLGSYIALDTVQCQQRACSHELVSALVLFLELKRRWYVKGFRKPF